MTINKIESEKSQSQQKDNIKKVPPDELDKVSGGTNSAEKKYEQAMKQKEAVSSKLHEMANDVIKNFPSR